MFQGWLANKKTKGVSTETVNIVAIEPRHLPGTIGQIQQHIVSSTAQSEFRKLQSENDKCIAELQKQI